MLGWTILIITLLFFLTLRVLAGRFMPRPGRPLWIVILLILTILAGAFLTVNSSASLKKSNARRNWNIAEGRVINSKIEVEGIYMPMVVYAYEVNGRAYVDTTNLQVPGFGNSAKQYQVAQELVNEYPVGKVIQVHYNPDKVTESVLITRPQWNVYGKLGLGVTLFGVGLFFLLLPFPRK